MNSENVQLREARVAQALFSRVPVEVMVSVGKAKPTVGELMQLTPDAVLQLDKKISDPVELYIGNRLIARGQLEELDGDRSGQLAVRLVEVIEAPGE